MKIKPRNLTGEITSAPEQTEKNEKAAAELKVKQVQANIAKGVTRILQTEDTVSIDLARQISSEFDPETIAADRKKKLEDIKARIAAGKYNPSSEDVAQRLAEEISLEILGASNS